MTGQARTAVRMRQCGRAGERRTSDRRAAKWWCGGGCAGRVAAVDPAGCGHCRLSRASVSSARWCGQTRVRNPCVGASRQSCGRLCRQHTGGAPRRPCRVVPPPALTAACRSYGCRVSNCLLDPPLPREVAGSRPTRPSRGVTGGQESTTPRRVSSRLVRPLRHFRVLGYAVGMGGASRGCGPSHTAASGTMTAHSNRRCDRAVTGTGRRGIGLAGSIRT